MGRGQTPAALQEAVGGSSRVASHWVSSLPPGDMGWWGHFRVMRDGRKVTAPAPYILPPT